MSNFFFLQELTDLIVESVALMSEVRNEIREKSEIPVVISGALGPRGDGYTVGMTKMTPAEAEVYHSKQIEVFANKTEADLVTAFTINYAGTYFKVTRL